jgi:alanine-synthesizing transaminase
MFSSRTSWRTQPNRLSQAIEERRARGLRILDLTESNPTRCGFKYDSRQILEALADPRALTYEPDPRGLAVARRAVAAYYAERGATVSPEQIFLTTSTSEAYSYVFRLLADAGDELLVPAPSYPLFDFLGRLNDLELRPYPLEYNDGWHIGMETLSERTTSRSRAILVVHPNNPTGSFVRRVELDALAKFCGERQLALVADEVFADFAFAPEDSGDPGGARVVTHAAENRVLTFTLSGLSKISALPQMKLAWLVVNGPQSLRRDALARLEIIADTYLSVSAPLAHALPELLAMRKPIQAQILKRVGVNLGHLDAHLAKDSPASRLQVEGGWYAVLRLPRTRSDEEWALRFLREDGVLAHPGHFYEFAFDGFLVISLLPRAECFEEGIARILARVAREA